MCIEKVGMIWVILDPQTTDTEIESYFQQLTEDLPQLGFTPQVALPSFSFTGNFNWKIGIEAFLEVYHFTHSHAPYLSDLKFPNLSLSDTRQETARIVVPLQIPNKEHGVLEWAQVMYFIFPSTFLLFYNDHVAMITLIPESIGTTSFRYTPIAADQKTIDKGHVFKKVELLKKIIAQDTEILEGIQSNLNSGANRKFTFTRLEPLADWFHRNVTETIS
jgi:phenylpropionate dioxygenase-like ring-hydroxylating dioxygenase large terminal subunit